MTDDTKFKITERPVKGDLHDTSRPTYEQWTAEQFLEVVDGILAIPEVEAIRWDQYTPYFNDGEPCEFGVNEVQVKLVGAKVLDEDDEDYDEEEGGFIDSWTLGYYAKRDGKPLPAGLEDALSKWSSGHFESVARKNFGDHAEVTATPEGFSVEFYDHD